MLWLWSRIVCFCSTPAFWLTTGNKGKGHKTVTAITKPTQEETKQHKRKQSNTRENTTTQKETKQHKRKQHNAKGYKPTQEKTNQHKKDITQHKRKPWTRIVVGLFCSCLQHHGQQVLGAQLAHGLVMAGCPWVAFYFWHHCQLGALVRTVQDQQSGYIHIPQEVDVEFVVQALQSSWLTHRQVQVRLCNETERVHWPGAKAKSQPLAEESSGSARTSWADGDEFGQPLPASWFKTMPVGHAGSCWNLEHRKHLHKVFRDPNGHLYTVGCDCCNGFCGLCNVPCKQTYFQSNVLKKAYGSYKRIL